MDKEETALVRAEGIYHRLLADDSWYQANAGKNIAIVGEVVMINANLEELLKEVERKHPNKRLFIDFVTRENPVVYLRSPRTPYIPQ